MSSIFFTSDTHFSHNKPFLYEPRGFVDVNEMNETLVQKWNEVIHSTDTVYHLGDIALTDTTAAISYLKRLNGDIFWILGNHDNSQKVEQIIANCKNIHLIGSLETSYATLIKDGKWSFYLSHYPVKYGELTESKNKKSWCLCGHIHTINKYLDIQDKCYHVELEAHQCYPVSLDEIKSDLQEVYAEE